MYGLSSLAFPSFFSLFIFFVYSSLRSISPCHVGTKVPEKQEVAGLPAKPIPVGPGKFTFQLCPCFSILVFLFFLPLRLMSYSSCPFSSLLPTEGAQSIVFEVRSSSTTTADLVEEDTSFFIHFEQVEKNDLDIMDFYGISSPYVDFLGY